MQRFFRGCCVQFRTQLAAVLVGLLVASAATAQQPEPAPVPSPLKLPATVTATLNVPVLVKAESTGKLHRWRGDLGLVVVPPGTKSNECWIVPTAKGRIKLVCMTVTDTDFVEAETFVVVDGAPAPTPPGPVPPLPPHPPTPPAPPADPLLAKLLASFLDDLLPAGLKKIQVKSLVAVYEAAAQLAADPTIQTTGDLLKRIKTVSDVTVAPGSLVTLRRLLSAELQASLGDDPAAKLTPEQRERAIQLFLRVARLLMTLA